MKLGFNKCRLTSISPEVGTDGSAGIDFFIPYYSKDFGEDLLNLEQNKNNEIYFTEEKIEASRVDGSTYEETQKVICIPPGKSVLIPSGIRTIFDKNNALLFVNKSGIASKKGLIVGACLIDSDYRGELHYHMINTTDGEVRLHFGQKIAQAIFIPHNEVKLEYIDGYDYDDIMKEEEENKTNTRGSGGFGSTGTKKSESVKSDTTEQSKDKKSKFLGFLKSKKN